MDAKITKQRLSHMLSYDWLKIILTSIGIILVWSLLFTMTATRIQPSQSFGFYAYTGTTVTDKFSLLPNRMEDVFSYEVIERKTEDINTGGEEYAIQIMEARLTTEEVDVLFVANVAGGNIEYTVDGETRQTTYLEDFLYRFYSYAYRLDGEYGYLQKMADYLNSYYQGDYTNPDNIDTNKIESDFRAKIKANKDKRYKTEDAIQTAVQGEIDRLQKYRQSLVDFNEYLAKGYIALEESSLYFSDYDGNQTVLTGCFSINLCPNEETMGELKKDAYYRVTDEETNETKSAVKDMNLIIIKDATENYGFEFERLSVVTYLVQTYCSELNPTA